MAAKFLTFRRWLRKYGKETQFRAGYLNDKREPNHTSQAEVLLYLKSTPFAEHSQDAKAAWRKYNSSAEVKSERKFFWTKLA